MGTMPNSRSYPEAPLDNKGHLIHDEASQESLRQLKSIGASLLYGFVALVMGFVNKGVLQLWPYSNTLLMLQMAASILIVYTGSYSGIMSVRPFDSSSAKILIPVVFFYNANVAFSLAGLQVLKIPIFNALKRLTPVMIIIVKFVIGDATPSRKVLYAVFTIVAGCFIAGIGDVSFDILGYSMALISCVLQTTYLTLVEKSGSDKGFNSNELLLYNATLSLPVLLILILGTGEAFAAFSAFEGLLTSSRFFFPLVVFSLIMGSLLNYTLFLCTLWNSALTTTVVGAMKGVVSSVLGFFILGGLKVTPLVVAGISMNTFGGIWYAVLKYYERKKRIHDPHYTKSGQNVQPILPTTTANLHMKFSK
ncbi:hypothetical protein O6H91_11G023300 [Diphasiastrum complanatum]|uniref:Uncharacterized protein n=2 Tax=Diphasiastrum complanatum TaxID=34168 RepID=A0ACC2C744_DIPCM|nr:hypothetical protein O6H91_11G023300 [Diphasiastrum complanatum]